MNKEINISILSDVIANKVIDSCNLNVNKQKTIANIISEVLDEYTIQRNVPTSTEIEIQTYVPVPKWAFEYLLYKKQCGMRDSSIKRYRTEISKLCRNINIPVEQLSTNDIRNYFIAYSYTHHASLVYLNNMQKILRNFFEWGYEMGYLLSNPMKNFTPTKFVPNQRHPLTSEELVRIRNACATYKERALVDLLYSSGVRCSELRNLKWKDIDFTNCTVNVVDGKGGKNRSTFMSVNAKVSLLEYKSVQNSNSEYVFTKSMYPFDNYSSNGSIENIVANIGKRANISKKITPHMFRHTFATDLMNSGLSVQYVQRLLGHSNIGTTMIYAKVDISMMKQDYNRCMNYGVSA